MGSKTKPEMLRTCNNDENQYQDQDQVKDAMHNKGVDRDEQQDGTNNNIKTKIPSPPT